MISTLAALFRGKQGHPRIYINGIEIDKIEPRLAFLDLDDWFTPFLKYVYEERKDWGTEHYIQTAEDPAKNKNARMIGIWYGPVPDDKKKEGYWTMLVYTGKKEEGPA